MVNNLVAAVGEERTNVIIHKKKVLSAYDDDDDDWCLSFLLIHVLLQVFLW